MLTPHELARLFVIVHAPEAADAVGPDIDALVEHDLVQCVAHTGQRVEIRVTPHGAQVLERLARGGPLSPAMLAKRTP